MLYSNPDTDGDGIADGADNCPIVANANQTNTDGDGMGDACDADDDNDGVADVDDAFPFDETESSDNDGDGTGDNADTDDDNDGVADVDDAFPFDPTESSDNDGDGTGDNADPDDDNDGCLDGGDDNPIEYSADSDCDGTHDDCDVCPGGDDNVDNNGDEIPDCSQLLAYGSYSSAWYCGNNKINVCHNSGNNPNTICINKNALAAHFNHGDMVGPCTSCSGQNMMTPANGGFAVADHLSLEVFPNPAGTEVTFQLQGFEENKSVELTVFDLFGRAVWQKKLEEGQLQVTLDVAKALPGSGVYLVRVGSGSGAVAKRLVVSE